MNRRINTMQSIGKFEGKTKSFPGIDELIAKYDKPLPMAQARRKWQLLLSRKRTPYDLAHEAGHTKQIQDFLDILRVGHYKHWQGRFSKAGVLDIVFRYYGFAGYIEVKTPGNTLSDEQKDFARRVDASHGIVILAMHAPIDEVFAAFDELETIFTYISLPQIHSLLRAFNAAQREKWRKGYKLGQGMLPMEGGKER